MQRTAPTFDKKFAVSRSTTAKHIYDQHLERADAVRSDSDREARLLRCRCKSCFYLRSGLAGQAFTHQECALCRRNQTYSSTNTDVLCLECAKGNSLCKHCGGDLDMNNMRSDWPTALPQENDEDPE